MIYYLTGTGNSRWAAQLLADHLHDTAEDAAPALKSGLAPSLHSEKPWVFVCPTYGWQIPHVFADLLRRTGFDGSRKAYFVLTCGDDIGAAGPRLRKLCGELGLSAQNHENYVGTADLNEKETRLHILGHLDVVGVALASAISQCVSAFLVLRALTRVQDCYALDFHKVALDPATTKRILALGLPAGFQNAVFAIANLFIQAGVNSFDSLMVKGNSAAANADNMIYDAMAAFYMACASFMSQNYGAGKPDRVKKSYFIALAYSFGVGLVLGGSLFIFGRQFLALFTTEGAVIDAGMKRVGVMGFAYCISAFMDCTIAASRGLGKTIVPTVIVVLGSCVFRVIWVYTIFAHFHTIPSLYLLYPCSWTLTAIAEIVYFIHAYKDSMKIFTQPQPAEV